MGARDRGHGPARRGSGVTRLEHDFLMRMIIFLVGLIVALIWIGVEVRPKQKPASNVLFAFAVLFTFLLIGTAYDLF